MASKLSNKRIISSTRQKQTRKKVLLYILSVILVGVVIYGVYGPVLHVKQVEVKGASHTKVEDVKAIVLDEISKHRSFIFPQRNRIFFPSNKTEIRIQTEVPSVEEVSVKVTMSGDVYIQIKDRRPSGIWCNTLIENDCYFFDDVGVLFKPSFAFTGSVYTRWDKEGVTLAIGQTVPCLPGCTDAEYVQFLAEHKITEGEVKEDVYILQSLDGYIIKASLDPKLVMGHVRMVEEKKVDLKTLEYIDARLENKIYYK